MRVLSGEVIAPTAELGDVARAGDGVRLAKKAFDLLAILELDAADGKRRGNALDETAERGGR